MAWKLGHIEPEYLLTLGHGDFIFIDFDNV